MPNSSNLLKKTLNFCINLTKIIFAPVAAAICVTNYFYENETKDYRKQKNYIHNNQSNTKLEKVELSRLDKFKCLSKSIKSTLHVSLILFLFL